MSNMKCPFCQQELNTENYYIHCHNPHCNKTVDMDGNEELWQELITTRKALDVAVDALKEIKALDDNGKYDIEDYDCQVARITQEAIEQINEITKS